jgi:hypothetical protein
MLISTNRYLANKDGPAAFILLPQSAIWWFLPGFAALTLIWDLTLWLWSLVGSKQVALQYEYWTNVKAGFNATRILRSVLYFADGSKWSSAGIGNFRSIVDPALLSFLEHKTGLQPVRAETEAELNIGN